MRNLFMVVLFATISSICWAETADEQWARFQAALSAVAPISSIDRGPPLVIRFQASATAAQKQAAQDAANSFDWFTPPEKAGLRDAAQQAVADDDAYLALNSTPTAAQVAAQVRTLTQHDRAIIKRLIQVQ